jgi:hypothetical protein
MAIPKLISIITEEINGLFLNEGNYQDEDIINADSINLQQEYDKLNRQLFNNELPKIPLQWSGRKTALGHVRSLINKRTGEQKLVHLAMSTFYKTSYRQFKNTLAHEMIHVKIIASGKRDYGGKHGYLFNDEANRINGMNLGFKITDRNTEEIEMSDERKSNAKTLIAMIFNIDGKYYLNVTTPSTYQSQSDALFNMIERLVNRGRFGSVEITVVESTNPELMAHRISRSFQKGFSYTPLNDTLLGQLLNEKIIKNIKIKRGMPISVSEDIESPDNSNDWEEVDII